MEDYYKILGVPRTATEEEIKKAYRKLAKENHPDYNPNNKEAEERTKEINEAYATLGDKDKKKAYDAKLNFQNSGPSINRTQTTTRGTVPSWDPIINFGDLLGDLISGINQKPKNWQNSLDPTEEFDKFMEYLKETDKETEQYGVNTQKYRVSLQHKRGIMTVEEIRRAKRDAEYSLNKVRSKGQTIKNFIYEYNKIKKELENQGETLEGDFSKYLNLKDFYQIDLEELKKARLTLLSNYNDAKRRINTRISNIISGFSLINLPLSDILNYRKIPSSRHMSKENMEELERMLELIKAIDQKLASLQSSIRDLFSKLRINPAKLTIGLLTIMNENIDKELAKGMFAKHRIMHMQINIPEEDEDPTFKM